jgi:hypothetical protein
MDKEPSVAALWMTAILLGLLGCLAGRWRRWASLPFIAWLGLSLWAGMGEVHDPFVGPAILREAGPTYTWHLYASSTLGLILAFLGMSWPKRAS